MTLFELVTFEVKERGVSARKLAKNCEVAPYIINQLLNEKNVSHEHESKVAAYFGYEFSLIIVNSVSEIDRITKQRDSVIDRLKDILSQDDGQAYKEAERFIKSIELGGRQ